MSPNLTFRHEAAADILGIREVVYQAFGRPGEADLVDTLRRADALTLSGVADRDGRIVGHVGFSPIAIGEQQSALALAPAAVLPECQRQGIGTHLIRWALEECRTLGHGVVLVLGSPVYYGRFGFRPSASFGLASPFPHPAEKYMYLELLPGSSLGLVGPIRYRPEFDSV